MRSLGIGVIGCGNISMTYLRNAALFREIELRACADLAPEMAQLRAAEHGIRAESVETLLAAPDVDLVLNLTVPNAHYGISMAALAAGKHVFTEKPLAATAAEGRALVAEARRHGLALGSAPDTFLGAAGRLARRLMDEGAIGRPVAGTAFMLGRGMEHWHPNPDFFFLPGGGPMFDLGPYYIADLINLIGPVKRVAALTSSATPTRAILTEGPRQGEAIPVRTPTNIHALLLFHSGATITLSSSWDVWAHRHGPIELYGTEGSLFVPDPNWFGGTVEIAGRDGVIAEASPWDHPFGVPNDHRPNGDFANYRTAGLADMAQAILHGRDARCALDRALHGVDVMRAVLRSGETGEFVDMVTSCERPAPLGPDEARALLIQR